jgi:hypothetical protein
VDASGPLQSIAEVLTGTPDDSVEDLLVAFDALVGVLDEGARPGAAQLLRHAAENSGNQARRDRLLSAAGAVASGQPCALTTDGLTAKQAAAAQTVTREEWEDRIARTPLPPRPGELSDSDDEDEGSSEEAVYMETPPPRLPHVRVRNFFQGMVVRVARDFDDVHGRDICSDEVLQVIVCTRTDSGYTVSFLERGIHLNENDANHAEIIENADNAWFQPIPTAGCIEELLEAIELSMNEAEDNEDGEDEDDPDFEHMVTLRQEIEECEEWLSRSGERGAAPQCRSGSLAATVFGRDHELAAWIPLLFAAVEVCVPD